MFISLLQQFKVRVISKKILVNFYSKHADTQTALEDWYRKVTKADWNNFSDLRNTFNSADSVGNKRYVFNIKGNNYRLVVIVLFVAKQVYIRFVGTHNDYDKIEDIQNV